MIQGIINNIIHEDENFNEELKELTVYFTAPKTLINALYPNQYPDAINTDISLSFSINNETDPLNADKAYVCISPIKQDGECFESYDWNDIDLCVNEIAELIAIRNTAMVKSLQDTNNKHLETIRQLNNKIDGKNDEIRDLKYALTQAIDQTIKAMKTCGEDGDCNGCYLSFTDSCMLNQNANGEINHD